MTLDEYLRTRNESEGSFGLRAGIQQPTIHKIRKGYTRPRVDMAVKIREATKAQPTDSGGWVDIDDLVSGFGG